MARHATHIRNTDSKGRITLGESFANRTMLVERHGDEIVLRLARVIPESEAWLYENPKALKLVRRGLDQASKHEFSQGPDMAAAAKLAGEIQDD